MVLFKTRKKAKKVKKTKTDREFAAEIIDIFETKLEELNISLPDKYRKNNADEARIYGSNYYDLEDQISSFISVNKEHLKEEIV